MDIVKNKLEQLDKTLLTLEQAVNDKTLDKVIRRDLMVLRFLYTSELCHKTLKTFLREKDVDIKYPSDVYRQAQVSGLITPEETEIALQMVKDRNFCAHAYQEAVVEKIAQAVPPYTNLMRNLWKNLKTES